MADSDLTTAATVADELGASASDARLARAVSAASDAIRAYLGRPALHYSASYVEKVKGFGGVRLILGLTPILSVASVTLSDGTAITDFTLEDSNAGFLYRLGGWPWTGLLRPGLLYADQAMGSEQANITVTYAGGWVTPAQSGTRTLPAAIEEACIQTVAAIYRAGGRDQAIASESLGDYSVTFRTANPSIGIGVGGMIPDSALAQLAPYRRFVP